MFWLSRPNPARAAQQDSATPRTRPERGQWGQGMTSPAKTNPPDLLQAPLWPPGPKKKTIPCFSSRLCLWRRSLAVLSLRAVYLPGQLRQQLQPGKHPAWTAGLLQPRTAACRWHRGRFCTCRRKQKKPRRQRALMQSHLCKTPGPRGEQRKATLKGEWHGKASAQKRWLCVAESKLAPTLQLLSKAKFHPDPSLSLLVCYWCPSSPHWQRQLCFSETRHLQWCQHFWWEAPTFSVLYVSWTQCQNPL